MDRDGLDYYANGHGEIEVGVRSPRGRAWRAEHASLRRYSIFLTVVCVVLLAALCVQKVRFDDAMAAKEAELLRAQPSKLPPVKVEHNCTEYAETPAADTAAERACHWTVWKF